MGIEFAYGKEAEGSLYFRCRNFADMTYRMNLQGPAPRSGEHTAIDATYFRLHAVILSDEQRQERRLPTLFGAPANTPEHLSQTFPAMSLRVITVSSGDGLIHAALDIAFAEGRSAEVSGARMLYVTSHAMLHNDASPRCYFA